LFEQFSIDMFALTGNALNYAVRSMISQNHATCGINASALCATGVAIEKRHSQMSFSKTVEFFDNQKKL
jgi:hypothetical protein